jgi:hypothetical protein
MAALVRCDLVVDARPTAFRGLEPAKNLEVNVTKPERSRFRFDGSNEQAANLRYAPDVRAVCGSSARTDLCGGRFVRAVPTATGLNSRAYIFRCFDNTPSGGKLIRSFQCVNRIGSGLTY